MKKRKGVINVVAVNSRFGNFIKKLQFIIANKYVCQIRIKKLLKSTPSICLYIMLLKLNSTEIVGDFISSIKTCFRITGVVR